MRFFIIRHGETLWNVEGRFQGQIDTDLNDVGLKQADLVAQKLFNHNFDAIISSPLKRALVTAQKIATKCKHKEVIINDALLEINHGLWEGCYAEEIKTEWPQLLINWHECPETVKMPGCGGESLNDILKRSTRYVETIAEKYDGDVLFTSHDAIIKVLLCYWLNAPLSSFWRFQIPNCSISIIEIPKNKKPRLILMGDIGHLGDSFDSAEQKGL